MLAVLDKVGPSLGVRFTANNETQIRALRGYPKELWIHLLICADDLVITSHAMEGMGNVLEIVRHTLELYGLQMNVTKTELLAAINGEGKQERQKKIAEYANNIHGHKYPIVPKDSAFKYLGQFFDQKGNDQAAFQKRIGLAENAIKQLKRRCFLTKDLSVKLKCQIFQAMVLIVLLYGTETWTPNAGQILKMDRLVNNTLRSILGIKPQDHEASSTTRQKCDISNITHQLRMRRLGWLGRMEAQTITGQWTLPQVALNSTLDNGDESPWKALIRKDVEWFHTQNFPDIPPNEDQSFNAQLTRIIPKLASRLQSQT